MKAITRLPVVLGLVTGLGLALAGAAGADDDYGKYRGEGKRVECEHREHRMGEHHGPGHDAEYGRRHAKHEACERHAEKHEYGDRKDERCRFRKAPKADDEA